MLKKTYFFEISKLFVFVFAFFTQQTFTYFSCFNYLNEGALLQNLIQSHCPCFEKYFLRFHNVQFISFLSQSYFTGGEGFRLNSTTFRQIVAIPYVFTFMVQPTPKVIWIRSGLKFHQNPGVLILFIRRVFFHYTIAAHILDFIKTEFTKVSYFAHFLRLRL